MDNVMDAEWDFGDYSPLQPGYQTLDDDSFFFGGDVGNVGNVGVARKVNPLGIVADVVDVIAETRAGKARTAENQLRRADTTLYAGMAIVAIGVIVGASILSK